MPAMAPSAALSAKAAPSRRETGMPSKAAPSRFAAQARIAWPTRVRRKNPASAAISTSAMPTIQINCNPMTTPPRRSGAPAE